MIFSTPVTPTRDRLTRVAGGSAWASRLGARTVSMGSFIRLRSMPARTGRLRKLTQKWVRILAGRCLYSAPLRVRRSYRGVRRTSPGAPGRREKGTLASIRQVAVADDQPFVESEELRGLIATG